MRLSKARRKCVTAMMRDTIFEAASSVVDKHGTAGLTMDRVASTVGLATGSLYNYFEGKNDLLQFFYTRLVEPFFQPIEEIARAELLAPQKLEKILHAAWEHAVKYKGLIRLFVAGDQRAAIRRDTRPRFLHILTAIFEQGIREGLFGPHNPEHMGRMFQGCLSELFDLLAEGAPNDELNEYVGMLIDATIRGFSVGPDKSPGSAKASATSPRSQSSS